MNPPRLSITFLYLLVIALGATLSYWIYHQGHQVDRQHRELLTEKLPLLREIAFLGQNYTEHERILYEFYATENLSLLHRELSRNNALIETSIEKLKTQPLSEETLKAIAGNYQTRQSIAQQLITTLNSNSDARWDDARNYLEKITDLGNEASPKLNTLVEEIQTQLRQSQDQSSEQLDNMSNLVSGFSVLLVLIALASGFMIASRLKEAKEKRRLALFVERNPNPVASLDWNGKLKYQNPTWKFLEKELGQSLLPRATQNKIEILKANAHAQIGWQEQIQDYCFQATLYKQTELHNFTLYIEDVTQRKRAEKELEYLAYHDPLTNLSNRQKLELDASYWMQHSTRQALAILLVGVDRFSQVTASHGFKVGDQIILSVKDRLEHCLKELKTDEHQSSLYRFTGAKFVVLLRSHDEEDIQIFAREVAHHIQAKMLDFIANIHGHFYLHLSLGVSFFPEHTDDFNTLLQNADAAYTSARKTGGNQYVVFDQNMSQSEKKWLETEVDLRFALHQQQFYLMYQPKVCSNTSEMRGVEALVRWQHPDKGLISPTEFIPVAEQSGLIVEIGEWILQQACKQTCHWIRSGMKDLVCAVNISPMQFLNFNFLNMVKTVLENTQLPPQHLELEITEGVLMHDVQRSTLILNALHAMGIKIAIDDFGTGYSSLSYLKSFSLDKLKIDKSFIDNITSSEADRAIVQTIINLAKNLQLKVIAEGVEDKKQLSILKQYGCDEIQGYLFSKPLYADELMNFAKKYA